MNWKVLDILYNALLKELGYLLWDYIYLAILSLTHTPFSYSHILAHLQFVYFSALIKDNVK